MLGPTLLGWFFKVVGQPLLPGSIDDILIPAATRRAAGEEGVCFGGWAKMGRKRANLLVDQSSCPWMAENFSAFLWARVPPAGILPPYIKFSAADFC